MNSKKLIIVGTVAALCIFGSLYTPSRMSAGTNFLSLSADDSEIEVAFINHIAKYQRSYASKAELPRRFQLFKKNFIKVKTHNTKPNALFEMELNQFADLEEHEYKYGPIEFTAEELASADQPILM